MKPGAGRHGVPNPLRELVQNFAVTAGQADFQPL